MAQGATPWISQACLATPWRWRPTPSYPIGMPVDLSKTKRFAVNLPIELAEEVERLAKADRRPAAAWLRNAIEDAVNAAKANED